MPVLLGPSCPSRVSVNPPCTPSSGSTAGGVVHVVQRSGPQGKAEAEARAARCPGEPPKSLSTSCTVVMFVLWCVAWCDGRLGSRRHRS